MPVGRTARSAADLRSAWLHVQMPDENVRRGPGGPPYFSGSCAEYCGCGGLSLISMVRSSSFDIKGLTEGLVTLRDHLYPNLALGHIGNFGDTLLAGAHLPGSAHHLSEFHHRASAETHDDVGAVHRFAGLGGHHDLELGQIGGQHRQRKDQEPQQLPHARYYRITLVLNAMKHLHTVAFALIFAVAVSAAPSGEEVYKAHCAACHDQNTARIPPRDALQKLPATRILRTLDFGLMMNIAYPLKREEREAVAGFLGLAGGEPLTPSKRISAAANWNGFSTTRATCPPKRRASASARCAT